MLRSSERQRLYRQRRSGKMPALVPGDLTKIDPPVVAAHLLALTCPFCLGGPFKNLGTHMFAGHGVSAFQAKDYAKVRRSRGGLIDEDVKAKLRVNTASPERLRVLQQLPAWASAIERRNADPTPLMSETRTRNGQAMARHNVEAMHNALRSAFLAGGGTDEAFAKWMDRC